MGSRPLPQVGAQQSLGRRGRARERGWADQGAGRGARAALRGWPGHPADRQSPALRLACHGAAVAGAAAADGAAAAAAAAAAGASRGALPGALQLPARRRPALPGPARRPHPTVSTRRPARDPRSLRATLSPYSLAPLPGSLEQKAWPYQIPPPFKVMRRQSLGTVFAPRAAPWVAHLPGALCSPWGSQARDFPVGAVATGLELPRSYGGSPAPCRCWKGTGCDVFLSAAVSVFDPCTSQLGEGYCDLWHPELL